MAFINKDDKQYVQRLWEMIYPKYVDFWAGEVQVGWCDVGLLVVPFVKPVRMGETYSAAQLK